MKDLISIAVLIATLYGGTVLGTEILQFVRKAALAKAAHSLPELSTLSHQLTGQMRKAKPANDKKENGNLGPESEIVRLRPYNFAQGRRPTL